MKYCVIHFGGISKRQKHIIGHRYPMVFQLQNVQMHLMTSITMKTIFIIKKVIRKDTLENHLHCLAVLRDKCAHAARMYNTDFNPPAKFTTSFLRKHPEIKNNSLFAYTLVLLKRLPDEESKKSLIQTVETVINEYRSDIDLNLIGFPDNYLEIMENNL